MAELSSETLHASCVAIGGRAVLIQGRSGAGKSDLALRLIDRGAQLVSDDYTHLVREGGRLLAAPPPTIAGKIEIRGLGIIEMAHVARVPVALLVELSEDVERMPPPLTPSRRIASIDVPVVMVEGDWPSAPIKVEHARRLKGLA